LWTGSHRVGTVHTVRSVYTLARSVRRTGAAAMADPAATASGMQTATIKTMIRCRPLPPGKKPVVDADATRQGMLSINHPTRNVEQEFEFDGLFPGETSQEKVRPS
jgi:hypothetical protein